MAEESVIVLKIGTSSIILREVIDVAEGKKKSVTRLNIKQMADVVEVVYQLKRKGHKVILINSGAVGAGCHLLKYETRPSDLSQCQALAACGQIHLMGKYENMFAALNLRCAQVLVTYDTFRVKQQNLNAVNTFRALLDMGVTPIVNENDTIATKEMQSDNDSMAAMISNLVGADYLFLLTDVPGLYTDNPHKNPNAKLITRVRDIEQLSNIINVKGRSEWGTGGMSTKLEAAKLATSMGIETVIMRAANVSSVADYVISSGRDVLGTTFERKKCAVAKQRRWIRCLQPGGKIVLDDVGVRELHENKGLGDKGIVDCFGDFSSLEPVSLVDEKGKEVAKGISNLSSDEIRQISESKDDDSVKSETDKTVIDQRNLVSFPWKSLNRIEHAIVVSS
mmetsp:Transcript_2029/g.4183  ORF Transcript_2029/g.4183 Transcript_2029/m.4183 type:complete len:394 (+) Transcript_2029:210-1391(+)